MTKKILSAGCSFTYGHELSDCNHAGLPPSSKTWARGLSDLVGGEYKCIALGGLGNSAIARKTFQYVSNHPVDCVLIMWSFPSRYDWAMPRNKNLEDTRWASITPWDTDDKQAEVFKSLSSSEPQQEIWKKRREELATTGVREFANSLYRYAANEYHEIYQSWKSIIWLQNILEKKQIPYLFTLADNSLFYKNFKPYAEQDSLMRSLHGEINFTNWYAFGERMMGFNQWALLNDYPRGTTHPLDSAHQDAVKLMKDKFLQIYNQKETQ
jgi:hypothetical protein